MDAQIARITDLHILSGEDEGFVITSEDRTLKVLLKRESGQFWPSAIQDLPSVPTKLVCDESYNRFGLFIYFRTSFPQRSSRVTGLAYLLE